MREVLSSIEVARIIGMSAEGLRQMCKRGQGPKFHYDILGHFRFDAQDVEAWLNERDLTLVALPKSAMDILRRG